MEWRLRRAGPGDAPALSLVAAATFLETFAGTIAGPDMVRHCTLNSSPAKFDAWIADPACVATLAEHPDGAAPVGYTLLTSPDLPVETDARDIELRRIYTLSLTNGTGLGHRLMTMAIDDARARRRRRMLLGVLGINERARAFYEREGFALVGTRQFQVGDTVFDDVVYARNL
ncbi:MULTISPECIES: GNAT family N-acetyltransferase [Sphingomonas]|jgi:diamine N-acetyltransferase|nr:MULTISPECIES: GNAT family N-acetyltransferase [Sphingomonas]MBB4047781.1 GNAT superfamily N-acetyltransferase [Sphingomonas zeae]MDK8185513.1 GNAT family N-acetyltransferase [Sphingomonas zeae]MDK8216736.1 GNAT family N-acetyltransferase [Sphingomonas sp. UMB7805-LC452B]